MVLDCCLYLDSNALGGRVPGQPKVPPGGLATHRRTRAVLEVIGDLSIEMNVAAEFEQIGVAFDDLPLETPASQVSAAAVAAVEIHRIRRQEPSYKGAEVALGRAEQQVHVVRHRENQVGWIQSAHLPAARGRRGRD